MPPTERLPTVAGGLGVLLVPLGVALTWWGVVDGHPVASVPGILITVAGLVALRVRAWVRKERVLRRVGHDLHVPPGEAPDRAPDD